MELASLQFRSRDTGSIAHCRLMPSTPRPASPVAMNRRAFLTSTATGAAALGAAAVTGCTATVSGSPSGSGAAKPPVRMKAGHQHDHSETTLRTLAAFGVTNICSGHLPAKMDAWSVDALTRLRQHVESFGVTLDAVPLPMSSSEITKAELPEILLAKDPARDRAIENICQMIRNAGKAGIPMVKYNLTFIGVVRTERTVGRGGAMLSTFDYATAKQEPALTAAGPVTEAIYWDRIEYFLKRVVPVADEAKVKIALHPQDPAMPPGSGWRGVDTVLGRVDGLKRFVATVPSAYHGLNFCQGTVSEMLAKPGGEIYDVIRYFGSRGKIFNVHFRNIRGGYLKFVETLPDDGEVDMPRALRTYREAGYDGMIMPDHVPQIAGDPGGQKAFAFCFGYIQALLQQLRAEA
jgi:mannonate dehydratase